MSTARFHVFSGTGNSLHLARSLAARLEDSGFSSELRQVDIRTMAGRGDHGTGGIAREAGDLDLFLFPVFAMAVPRIMLRYMKALGRPSLLTGGERPRAAILSTNGRISARIRDGHEGQALAQAERLLSRLGWEVTYRDTIDYPQSITSAINPQDEERRAAIMALAQPRIEAVAQDLASGRRHKRPCRPVFHLLGWPFGWLYRIFGRRALAMLFAADGRCDGCGACARRCPAEAIRMAGGRPDWSYACEGCERCINECPNKAIQTSAVRVAAMVALCVLADACPLRPLLLEAGAAAGLPAWLAGLLWYAAGIFLAFVLFRLIDLVLFALSFVPGLREVLGFGWTRWFRRYRGPDLGTGPL